MRKGIGLLVRLKDVRFRYPIALLLGMAVLSPCTGSRADARHRHAVCLARGRIPGPGSAKASPICSPAILAQVPSLAVLEREQLQAFLKEMDLGQAPLFDQTCQALQLGRVAKVEDVLYGTAMSCMRGRSPSSCFGLTSTSRP